MSLFKTKDQYSHRQIFSTSHDTKSIFSSTKGIHFSVFSGFVILI